MDIIRRMQLAAMGGSLLAASPMVAAAMARNDVDAEDGKADVLYGHGMVWNRDLPGLAGALNLGFDLRVNLETGVGSGSANDPVHPEWNLHFAIHSLEQEPLRQRETRYTLRGLVTEANSPGLVGLPVRIIAQTRGDATAIAIALGDLAFGGAGLVVIAIIAVMISLLIPAVQKIR